jgi:hypothetical protein
MSAGLVEACDSEQLFGVELTPRQRERLTDIEDGHFLLAVWAMGRRSGKTLLMVLVGLWLCLLRPDLARYVRRRERRYVLFVATNLRQARLAVELARSIIEASPLLRGLVESVTDDEIRFRNGTALVAFPCTSRGGRGWPVMGLFMDEAAHFIDGDGNQAADPVFRSLSPSVSQFGSAARIIVASSPYGTDGWFADLYGTVAKGDLDRAVCARASTMEMRPGFEAVALDLERQRDPDGFRAEYLAEFVAAGGAFLDPGRVAAAAARTGELPPGAVVEPVAALDLGFVHDSTALAIVGRDRDDRRRLRLVLTRRWSPDVGPLGFGPTLDEIVAVCRHHGVRFVYTDAFSATAAVEYLAVRGLHATVVPTTARSKSEMFASLKTRLYGGELELYDHPGLIAELHRIETLTTPGAASVRIRRLGSSHGDLATALALACSRLRGTARYGSIAVPRTRIPGVRGRDGLAEVLATMGVPTTPGQDPLLGAVTVARPVVALAEAAEGRSRRQRRGRT